MQRTPCIFCGSVDRKLTREHIFGQWMKAAFDGVISEVGNTEIRCSGRQTVSYETAPFDDTIGGVCYVCNNHWMEHIETLVQPTLTPMMTGGFPTSLTREQRNELATWAMKTVLVLDQLNPKNRRTVPESTYSDFFQRKAPSSYHEVSIGRIDPRMNNLVVCSIQSKIEKFVDTTDARTATYFQNSLGRGQWMYVTTFSIGFVVFQVFGHNLPKSVRVRRTQLHRQALHSLWPGHLAIKWPSGPSIDTMGGLVAAHDAYTLVPPPLRI